MQNENNSSGNIIFVDQRDPLKTRLIMENLEKSKSESDFEVSIKVTTLPRGDIVFIAKHLKRKLLIEIKRINTGDFAESRNSGRLKNQINELRKPDFDIGVSPWFVVFINETGEEISFSDKKSMMTLDAQIESLGGRSKFFDSFYFFARWFIKTCIYMSEKEPVVFQPYCDIVEKDQSDLTKMLIQRKGFGSTDAEIIGRQFDNFLQVFFSGEMINEMKSKMTNDEISISNMIRKGNNKNEKNKPLKKITDLFEWFFKTKDD